MTVQSFIVLASLVLELVGGQNDPLGTNVAKNPSGLKGLMFIFPTMYHSLISDFSTVRVTRCDLSDQFVCIHARSLCRFLSDEI